MDLFRVTIISALVVTAISMCIEILINYDGILVVTGMAIWMAFGQVRVYGTVIGAPTYALAFKGALMSMAWPLVPKRR